MLSKKMEAALNDQINAEYFSSYLYLSMAAYAEKINLKGFAHWFQLQSHEEMVHTMKLYRFVLDRRGVVELKAIQAPATGWESPLAVFEAALAHERAVSEMIDRLVELAVQEHDNAAHVLLEWFVNEQVEEEAAADLIVERLKMAEGTPAALLMIDNELAARVLASAAGAAT